MCLDLFCSVYAFENGRKDSSMLSAESDRQRLCLLAAFALFLVNAGFHAPSESCSLKWIGISFNRSLDTVSLGLKSEAKESDRITEILINGRNIPRKAFAKQATLTGGTAHIITMKVEEKLARGDDVFVICKTARGQEIRAGVRAFAHFPILREETLSQCGLSGGALGEQALPHPLPQLRLIMGCLSHKHGTFSEAGHELARRYSESRKEFPRRQCVISICKHLQKEALSVFSPLADSVVTNPMVETKQEHEQVSGTLGMFISECCAPTPWLALITTEADKRFPSLKGRTPTFVEVEWLVWRSIGDGCKGIVYRGESLTLEKRDFQGLQHRIAKIAPLLIVSIPIHSAEIHGGKAHLSVLQAANEELIVILTNNTLAFSKDPLLPPSVELLQGIQVEIPVPEGLAVRGSLTSADRLNEKGRSYSYHIDCLRYVEVDRIELEIE